MSERKYRLIMLINGTQTTRDVMLDSTQPVIDILNWPEDEYDFRAKLKKVFVPRDDGVEEQIY